MKSAQLKMRFKDSIYFNFLSLFYSSFLPGGMLTGETIKCYKVSKGQYGKNKIIMSVAFDRLITFACYIFMGTFFLLLVYNTQIKNYQILLTAILVMAFVTIVLVLIILSSRMVKFVFSKLDKLLLTINQHRYINFIHELKESF